MKYSAHHWTTSINFLIKNAKWKRSWEKEAMRDKAECNNEKQYCWKSHYHEEKCLWNYKLNNKTSLSSTSVFQPRIRWKSQENTVTSIFFFSKHSTLPVLKLTNSTGNLTLVTTMFPEFPPNSLFPSPYL